MIGETITQSEALAASLSVLGVKTNSVSAGLASLITGGFAGLKASATSALAALAPLAPILIAIAAAVAAVAASNYFSPANDFKRLSESASDARTELQNTQQEMQSIESELDAVSDKIDEINAKDGLTLTDKAELADLEQQKELLEAQLEIQERLADIKGASAASAANKVLTAKDFQIANGQNAVDGVESMTYDNVDIIEYTKHVYDELQEAQEKYNSLVKEQSELDPNSKAYKEYGKAIESYSAKISSLGDIVAENSGIINENYNSIITTNGQARAGFEDSAAAAEEFFDYIMSDTDRAAKVESQIATILSTADMAGVQDKLVNAASGGSDALADAIANTEGLQSALDRAGVSAADFSAYIMSLAGSDLGNIEEQVKQLSEDFLSSSRNRQAQSAWDEFIKGLSDEEIHIFYDYVKDGDFDLSQWDMDDVEYNYKIAMDASDVKSTTTSITALGEAVTNMNNALSEQASSTGLTSESIQHIKDMFSGLDSYDQSALFEKTATGVRLNRTELERLNAEYDNQQRQLYADELSNLSDQYNALTSQINNCADAEERSSLISQRDSIASQIDNVQLLASEFEGLTSAYNKWVSAQSTDNDRDSYEGIAKGYESMKEIFDAGWFNDDSLTSYLDMMLGDDRVTDTIEAWGQLTKTIDGTSHSLMDYFQQTEDGTIVTDGLFAFMDDVRSVFGDAYSSIAEDGSYALDLTGDKIDKVAEKFNIGKDAILYMVQAMRDIGMDVSLDPIETSLDDLTEKAKTAGMTVDEYLNYWSDRGVQFSVDGKVNVDTSEAEQKIDSVGSPAPLIEADVNVDTADAAEDVSNIPVPPLEPEVKPDTSGVSEAVNAAGADANETATIKVLADVEGTENVQALHNSIELITEKKVDVLADTKNSIPLVNRLIAAIRQLRDKTVTITTINRNIKSNSQAKSTNGSEGTGRVRGTAHKRGTAHSTGRYGTAKTEKALIGEVGPEMVVDPETDSYTVYGENGPQIATIPKGAIIFDAWQTEDLLSGGHTSSYGQAFINGTAYASASGLQKRTSTTKATSVASSSTKKKKKSTSKKSNSKSGSSTSKALEAFQDWFSKLFDWIEVKLSRLERITDNYIQHAEAKANNGNYGKIASSSKENNTGASKWYVKALDAIGKQLTANKNGASKYQSEANAVLNKAVKSGIISKKQASTIKTKVANGTINISEYGEKMQEVIKDYQQW